MRKMKISMRGFYFSSTREVYDGVAQLPDYPITTSAEPSPMLLQNAFIHHHEDPRLARLLRRFFVDNAFLQPDRRHLQPDRFIHHIRDELRPPKHIYHIDLLRHVGQRSNSLLSQRAFDGRVDRDNAVARGLHVRAHAVTWTQRAVRQADYGNGFGAF